MTLLEAVQTHDEETALADALRGIPGAVALVTARLPTGGFNAVCVIDEYSADFYEVEERAIEALMAIRRAHPSTFVDLLCVSTDDASQMDFPGGQVHPLDGQVAATA